MIYYVERERAFGNLLFSSKLRNAVINCMLEIVHISHIFLQLQWYSLRELNLVSISFYSSIENKDNCLSTFHNTIRGLLYNHVVGTNVETCAYCAISMICCTFTFSGM